jgi:UDP-N-acetyl-D-mannosaminuronate dehydrogenase
MYLWNDPEASVVRAARAANAAMPIHAVNLLEKEIGSLSGKKVAVLGAAYRGGVKETAFSGVFPLVAELSRRGADPAVHDPMYSDQELTDLGFIPFHFGEVAEAAIIQADHSEYKLLSKDDLPNTSLIIDGRHILGDVTGLTVIQL